MPRLDAQPLKNNNRPAIQITSLDMLQHVFAFLVIVPPPIFSDGITIFLPNVLLPIERSA
jgi:hypothetical protein